MVYFILSGKFQTTKSKNITNPPILPFCWLILISRDYVFTTHHFDHFVITYMSLFNLLKTKFLACFEVVIALDLLSCKCFSFSTIGIRVYVLTQLYICCLTMFDLHFGVVFVNWFILITICEVLLLTNSGLYRVSRRDMCLLFVSCRFCKLCFLDKILNSWSLDILFVFFICFDRRWPRSLSLYRLIHTCSGSGTMDLLCVKSWTLLASFFMSKDLLS